jgi:hypothetical protein
MFGEGFQASFEVAVGERAESRTLDAVDVEGDFAGVKSGFACEIQPLNWRTLRRARTGILGAKDLGKPLVHTRSESESESEAESEPEPEVAATVFPRQQTAMGREAQFEVATLRTTRSKLAFTET